MKKSSIERQYARLLNKACQLMKRNNSLEEENQKLQRQLNNYREQLRVQIDFTAKLIPNPWGFFEAYK